MMMYQQPEPLAWMAAVDEVDVVDHDCEDDGWEEASLMSSVGLSSMDVVDRKISPLELCHSAEPVILPVLLVVPAKLTSSSFCPQH